MSRKKKKKPKPKPQQGNAKPASTEIIIYPPNDSAKLPVTQEFAGGGSLPPVTEQSLLECYRYLAARLTFPFEATYEVETENDEELESAVTILGLIEPDDRLLDDGLFCKGLEDGEEVDLPLFAVDVSLDSGNRKLIEGYSEWYLDGEEEEVNEITFLDRVQMNSFNRRLAPLPFWHSALFSICACGIFGFVLGAVIGSMEIARLSALVGAAIVGSLGGFLGSRVGRGINIVTGSKPGGLVGGAFGMIAGGVFGAAMGAALVAFVGILGGAVVGSSLGALIRRPLIGFFAGLLLGPLALALFLDKDNALMWGMHGDWIGALAAGVLVSLSTLLKRGMIATKNKAATSGSR